jgi:hypothetical protein
MCWTSLEKVYVSSVCMQPAQTWVLSLSAHVKCLCASETACRLNEQSPAHELCQ